MCTSASALAKKLPRIQAHATLVHWRLSLRTLLIATTLIAVGLGAIVLAM